MNENKNGAASPKWGRHPKESRKSHCVMVRFDDGEWLRFLAMYEKSGVYAKAVFLKTHFFGQPFRVLVTDKALLDYCTKLSAFHAQYRAIGIASMPLNRVSVLTKTFIQYLTDPSKIDFNELCS